MSEAKTPQDNTPQDNTKVIGKVDAAEMQSINSLQTREQEMTYRVGQMFRELLGAAMQAGEVNRALQGVMQGIRTRLNVPEENLFRITYDGNVHLVDPQEAAGPAPVPPAEAPEETAEETTTEASEEATEES